MNWKTFKEKFVTGNPFTKIEGHFSILPNGYKFNQYIFYFLITVIVLLGGIIFYNLGFSTDPQIYYKCDNAVSCENPFYKYNTESTLSNKYKKMCTYEWCNEEVLPGGFEFGRKPTFLERNFAVISIFILICAFILNHLLYNPDEESKNEGLK